MKELSLKEIKEVQLGMLKYFIKVCKENNLKWFLSGGTLLGAIRHKGYIPWDDDIDLFMPRKDYRKFLELVKDNKEYTILNPYDYEDYYYLFSKLVDNRTVLYETGSSTKNEKMGVFIDIFPLDGLPENYGDIEKHYYRLVKLNRRYINSITHTDIHGFKNRLKQTIKIPYIMYCKLVGIQHWKKLILETMEKYDYDEGGYVGFIVSLFGLKQILNRRIFADSVDVEFEGETVPAPVGYVEYLTTLYGDYMQLPPEEKRVTPHTYDAYWR